MTDIERKTGMTDAECEYWDTYYTQNSFEPGENLIKQGIKPGFAHDFLPLSELDRDVREYLSEQAAIFHKSKIKIINDLIREKLAAAQ